MTIRSVILSVLLCAALIVRPVSADDRAFPTDFDWGKLVTTETAVELRVSTIPDNRIISIPRLNNPYRTISLQSDAEKRPLKFHPEISEWQISLPESASAPVVVVIETVGTPRLLATPFVVEADDDGVYDLNAHHAIVHGDKLRYEPQPHKNTIGYWANETDWCEWKLNVTQPGRFQVRIVQGCSPGSEGSEIQIKVGASRLTYSVRNTGGFNDFEEFDAGSLVLEKGEQSLQVKAQNKTNVAVMDLRQIRLIPVEND